MSVSGGSGSTDPTMLELFAAEVDMHLPVLSEGLLAMEKGRAGKKEIESMMRAAHSIKGAARIVGIDAAVRIAHGMEDSFSAAKEDRITLGSDAVDVLLQGVDALQRACSPEPESALTEEDIQSLLQRIAGVREGKTAPPAQPAQAAPARGGAPSAPSVAMPAQPPLPTDSIVVPEPFDHSAAESLRSRLCDILERRPERIRFDFSRVEHLNVTAMSLLLSFAGEAKEWKPASVIEAHRVVPAVRAVFRVVGLDDAFVIMD